MTERGRHFDRAQRWRLILGPRASALEAAEKTQPESADQSTTLHAVERVLERVYGKEHATLDAPQPSVLEWLDESRLHFDRDSVAMLQRDVLARDESMNALLFEPELLERIEPSMAVLRSLLELKDRVPQRAREAARAVVDKIVRALASRLTSPIEQAVRTGLRRSGSGASRALTNVHWKRTIQRNLQGFDHRTKKLHVKKMHFWSRHQPAHSRDVIVALDQSGSMTASAVHGAIMASVFASIPALHTTVFAFSTEIADLSAYVSDPVELLFGLTLGGGTHLTRAIQFGQQRVSRPDRTLFVLVSDLYDGASSTQSLAKLQQLHASGVTVLCLLALDENGQASFNAPLAHKLMESGIACFACSPFQLPAVLETALSGQQHALSALSHQQGLRRA
ncbi:MAG: VWA domain-containing protein [Deltaproteobacteria bacterium]|nr:VWA domain-containing protein [Deltaproteobacteria bacterium]